MLSYRPLWISVRMRNLSSTGDQGDQDEALQRFRRVEGCSEMGIPQITVRRDAAETSAQEQSV